MSRVLTFHVQLNNKAKFVGYDLARECAGEDDIIVKNGEYYILLDRDDLFEMINDYMDEEVMEEARRIAVASGYIIVDYDYQRPSDVFRKELTFVSSTGFKGMKVVLTPFESSYVCKVYKDDELVNREAVYFIGDNQLERIEQFVEKMFYKYC